MCVDQEDGKIPSYTTPILQVRTLKARLHLYLTNTREVVKTCIRRRRFINMIFARSIFKLMHKR